jgi:hypothetical protein
MTRTKSILAAFAALMLSAACEHATVKDAQGNKLTLLKPADQTVRQGETNQVSVVIDRSGFTDPVSIEFAGLPAGVRVVEADRKIARGDHTANFTLQADANAALVSTQAVTVTAYTPTGSAASKEFYVTVKQR